MGTRKEFIKKLIEQNEASINAKGLPNISVAEAILNAISEILDSTLSPEEKLQLIKTRVRLD